MVSEREIESDRMFNQMLLTDAEKAFLDRVWPKLQNGCYRTHSSIPVEIRGLNFNEFVRDGLCAVLEATAPQPSGKIEEAVQIIQAFIDQGVDYIKRNNTVEEALHHLKIIESEANRVTNPVTKNNLLYEIERIRSALTAGKLEQAVPSGWQPIETAPKDGTNILGWHEIAGTSQTCFSEGEWMCPDWDEDRYIHCTWSPTHWMPLPTPPTARGAERSGGRGGK